MKKLFGLGKGLNSLIPAQNIASENTEKESVFLVELNKIQTNPDQPRKDFDDDALSELAQSIREHGILQPLLVAKVKSESLRGMDVSYQLIAGERRLRAARLAGLPRVPVVIRNSLDAAPKSQRLELALIENLQREDLNPLEEAVAYERLRKEFNLTQKEVADKVGKSREAVANAVRLINLPKEIKDALQGGRLSKAHARALLAFSSEEEQLKMFRQILAGGVSSKDVESTASNLKGKPRNSKKDNRFVELEENLKETLKVPVLIQSNGQGGKIVIRFATVEELTKVAKNIID